MDLLPEYGLGSVAIFTVLFILLVDLMHRRQRWTSRYPPGPVPLPVLGNMLQVDLNDIPNSIYKLRQRYGDVFSLQMAWKPVVVVNGLKAVREVLVNCGEFTADRPPIPIFEHLSPGPKAKGRPFNPNTMLDKATCNVISSLIFARRFEYEDPYLIRMLKLLEEGLTDVSGFIPEVLNMFPILLRIPGLADKVLQGQKNLAAMLGDLLTEHRKTQDPEQPPRDLTDAFLAEVEKAKGNPESSFNDENLHTVVADLFAAGIVSTSTTLSWALLLMILYPDVQSRVQQEIDEVIGQARRPEMADQARMPFTNAVIHEVQRFGDISPLNLPCITSRDIKVQGFLIPKGTTLIPNLSSVLKDETVWEKPLQFHPEHFLDAQGRFVKHEAFMPFSAGRRACLGEPLARMELFLFFTYLMQCFSFLVPDGQPRPSDQRVVGVLATPSPYELCAVSR
ncbi:cytochrome P450 2D28-like isoform X2 [Peromyscus californicus insignis]|uniref:cytochrome P450 2D28-like isoform X2 n=1 Tax=Peromyscus californicus insignis TaxID=564181 RepID=UPI0022A7135B|nr:cytochrome P450 2D28-like isoform X2 [Peromyscus californicus insignis]